MTLQIKRALENGVTKTVSRAGLTFVVLVSLAQIAFLAATNTVVEAWLASLDLPAGATEASMSSSLSLPVSATVAGVFGLVLFLVLQVLTIVLIRVMAADRQVITTEHYTRRMGWVVLNSLVGGIVIGVLTMLGFVLLIIPGLFLTVSLLFTTVYIADQDENFLTAVQDSWGLTSGNRWRLFGLYAVVLVAFFIVTFAIGFVLSNGTILSLTVSTIIISIMVVYMMAAITDAYRQLRGETQTGSGGAISSNTTSGLD